MDWLEIHALADGQLDGSAKADAEAKLSQDSALKAEFEAIQSVKLALRRVEPVTCAKTWAKCRERLAEIERRSVVEGFVGRYAWGLCTIFLAVIVGAGLFNRAFKADGIGTGEAARVLSGLTASAPQVNQAVPMQSWIKPRPEKKIRVLAQRLGQFDGHPVVRYDLEDPEGKLAILGIGGVSGVEGVEPMLENQEYSIGKLNGTNCVTWSDGDDTVFLVADRPYEKLADVATELRQE